MTSQEVVIEQQLQHLDDTDTYATSWSDAVSKARSWGGRGQGGRGLSRRTRQFEAISVPDVRLEYIGTNSLLENAHLKLLTGHVYALVGHNGCGKSSLLRRINAGKVPGFPPHVSTLYLSQESEDTASAPDVVTWLIDRYQIYCKETVRIAGQARMDDLEGQLEALDVSSEDPTVLKKMEDLAEEISTIENDCVATPDGAMQKNAHDVLNFMGVHSDLWVKALSDLTAGNRKKVLLALAMMACCSSTCNLLLLDEPSHSLDINGLLQLRQLVDIVSSNSKPTSVVMVSHDIDLINNLATDIIEFSFKKLIYYAGNYADYMVQWKQLERRRERQECALEKRTDRMVKTLENLKKLPTPRRRGGAKKKSRLVTSHKKKMGRVLGDNETVKEKNEFRHGDRPHKAVQFAFQKCKNKWNEPLISALDVGHGFIVKKQDNLLFDCVDLSVDEESIVCIMGESGAGKSTLLKILAKEISPIEGKVLHASNVKVALFDHTIKFTDGEGTPLSFLASKFPKLSEEDIRGELSAFGLGPSQVSTGLNFLSGGERGRFCLAHAMMHKPEVLLLDQPTANLDVESVEALIFGLKEWNGTVVVVSHDAYFLRALEARCYVLLPSERKLRRVNGGVNAYLKSFG